MSAEPRPGPFPPMSSGTVAQGLTVGDPAVPEIRALGIDQSHTIRVARVLCIWFMMATHAWPGSERILAEPGNDGTHLFNAILVDMLGRASVPLLSIISGILFVYSFSRRSPLLVIRDKAKVLLVPMVVWSVPMIAIGVLKSRVTSDPSPLSGGTLDLINLLIPLTAGPANGPLHFLRDIFVMCLYGSTILIVFNRSWLAGCALAAAIGLVEQTPGGFLVFRNQIATMFIFGLLLARLGQGNWRPPWLLVIAAMAVFLTMRLADLLATEPHLAFRISEHVPRIAMALFMWRIAHEVVARAGPIRSLCFAIEPHIFTVFCLHAILASMVGGAVLVLGFTYPMPFFPLFLLAQLVMFSAAGVIASRLLTPFLWLRGRTR